VYPQPLKVFEDLINGGIHRSFNVRIFDPKDKGPLMMFREEIVEECGSSVSNMEQSSRRRGEADVYIRNHLKPSAEWHGA
jgi:hypothetical protein